MIRPLFVLDPDRPGEQWAPFSGVRPIAELRAGAFRIAERWERYLGSDRPRVISPATPGFADVDSLPLHSGPIVGPATVARSEFVPLGPPPAIGPGVTGLTAGGDPIAWIVAPGEIWAGPTPITAGLEIRALQLGGTRDLITACERLLEDDCADLLEDGGGVVPSGAVVIGNSAHLAVRTASVEPHTVFDVRKGPIVLEANAVVRAGSRLEGPLYLGPHSWIVGGAVRHSVIGPHCRVHGELATTVMLGYANKSHDGFVGHSILGHWVNLGAGTITSNLKNTYGPIRLELPTGRIETGRTLLGSLIGDHAKTGIGTLLSAGTVIGPGANVIAGNVPRFVRPFAWGADDTLTLDGFLTIAGRVMPRRGVEVTAQIEAALAALHARFVG